MKKNRIFKLFTSFSAFLLVFTACSAPAGTGPSNETGKPAENITLTFMSSVGGDSTDHMKALVDNYHAEGVTIKYEAVHGSTAEYQEKIETMFAGGTYPDIMYIPTVWSKRHASMDLAYDLTDVLPKDVVADFAEGPLATTTVDGRIIGLPMNSDCISLYYNKDMFAKAGITDVPTKYEDAWTWDEFLAVAQKVKDANGTPYGVAMNSDYSCLLPFIWQAGATILNDTQTSAAVNQQGSIDALNWFRDSWINTKLCSTEVFTGVEAANDLFIQRQVPMAVTHSGVAGAFVRDISTFEFGVTYLPYAEKHANKIGGWNMEIIKKTKYPKEALDFLLYIMGTEQMNQFCAATGNMPTRKSSQESIDLGQLAPYAPVFMDEISKIPSFATNDCVCVGYSIYKPILTAEVQNFLITPTMTAEQAVAEMETQINQALKQ